MKWIQMTTLRLAKNLTCTQNILLTLVWTNHPKGFSISFMGFDSPMCFSLNVIVLMQNLACFQPAGLHKKFWRDWTSLWVLMGAIWWSNSNVEGISTCRADSLPCPFFSLEKCKRGWASLSGCKGGAAVWLLGSSVSVPLVLIQLSQVG